MKLQGVIVRGGLLVATAIALAARPVEAQQCPGWHDYTDPNSSVSGGGTGAAAAEADMKKRARALCKVACDDWNDTCGKDQPYCSDVDVEVEKVGASLCEEVPAGSGKWSCAGRVKRCKCDCEAAPSPFHSGVGAANGGEDLALRLSLPPAELAQPGTSITGRVIADEKPGRPVQPEVVAGLLSGLVVEAAGQTTRVDENGLFVLQLPAAPGQLAVAVRSVDKPFLMPIEDVFSIAGRGTVVVPAGGRTVLQTPPVVLPDQPCVVRGTFPSAGVGLATRAYLGAQEAPLLWMTEQAAAFDVSRIAAGPHLLSLYEGGELMAAGIIHRVTLTARSDKSELARGERANFDILVEGLPRELLAQGEDAARERGRKAAEGARAYLDYVNVSPAVGRFIGKPERFSVPILTRELTARSVAVDRSSWAPRELTSDPELLELVQLELRELLSAYHYPKPDAPLPSALAMIYSFADTQRYAGATPGQFLVNVTVRLPEGVLQAAPNPLDTLRRFELQVRQATDFALEALLQDLNRRKDVDYGPPPGAPGPHSAWLWERIQVIMQELTRRGYTFAGGTMTRPDGRVVPVR